MARGPRAFSDFRLREGDAVLVFGAGPVGLSFCRFGRLLGMGWIGAVDPLPGKREKAAAMGADATFAPDAPELAGLRALRGAPQEPLVEWIRAGTLSHRDFVGAEYPVRDAAKGQKAASQPGSIKTLLRF